MTRSEYEARRRRLDEELRAVLEAVQAGHQARIQLLELMWGMSNTGVPEPQAPPPATPKLPEPEPRPRRRGAGELMDGILEVLPGLPELFTKDDIETALGERIDRASLLRILRELEQDGWLRTETLGRGRYPTVYRRMHSPASAPDSGHGAETS
ncbi:MAG TPA: hypothetical protein VNW71_00090 [Thermoanaerobaculia bacterium]|nr:hypothetical protein [Thermoanaerobaculia bacterium]